MPPLDNYYLVGHCLVNDERGFGHPELILKQVERDNVFVLQHMRRVGCPKQYLKTALPEGASGRGHVLVQTLQNI